MTDDSRYVRNLEEERDELLLEVDILEERLAAAIDETDELRGRLLESRGLVLALINAQSRSH